MKRLPLKLVAALAVSLLLPQMMTAGVVNYTATYDLAKITIGIESLGGVAYNTVNYPGLYNSGEPGAPSLPIDYINFSVPYNAANFKVTSVLRDNAIVNTGNYMVLPCQQSWHANSITLPSNTIYSSNTYYPASNVWVVDSGFLAGENHIVTVAVMPVSFLHHETGDIMLNQLRETHAIDISLSYETSNSPTLEAIVKRDTVLRNKGYKLAQRMVVNPDDVLGFGVPTNAQTYNSPYLQPDGLQSERYDYIVVTVPNLLHSMRRLVAFNRQKGYSVKLVTVNDAVTDPLAGQGDVPEGYGTPYLTYIDDAGKLRQYLREHYYNYGTQYVLLAGSQVPFRNKFGGASDMYYSDLSYDWQSMFDFKGELSVGRLLGTDANVFDNYTDKLFRYELNPGNGSVSYVNNCMILEDYDHETCFSGGFVNNADTLVSAAMIEDIITGNDVINLINNNHYGIVGSFNNGTPSYINLDDENGDVTAHYIWAVDTVKVPSSIMDGEYGNGLNNLQNKDYPIIWCSESGNTIPYCAVNGYEVDLNFGMSFTMGKDYGGPAYMGLSKNVDSFPFSLGMFSSNLLGSLRQSSSTIGEIYLDEKSRYHGNTWEERIACHNLLGDPAIEVWNDTPSQFSNVSVVRGNTTITVSGITSYPVKVAYCNNDGVTGTVEATTSSAIINDVSPNSTVMLCKRNYIPYIAPLVIQNTTLNQSQYVIASDVTMGKTVDSNRTSGQVTITGDIEYEIEHTGEVRFCGGFKVEKGTRFSVKPSTYNK